MSFKQQRQLEKCFGETHNTHVDYRKTFPETTNQWYGRQVVRKCLPYEIAGPMVIRTPYVRERRIGGWSAD